VGDYSLITSEVEEEGWRREGEGVRRRGQKLEELHDKFHC